MTGYFSLVNFFVLLTSYDRKLLKFCRLRQPNKSIFIYRYDKWWYPKIVKSIFLPVNRSVVYKSQKKIDPKKRTQKVDPKSGPKKWTQKVDPKNGPKKSLLVPLKCTHRVCTSKFSKNAPSAPSGEILFVSAFSVIYILLVFFFKISYFELSKTSSVFEKLKLLFVLPLIVSA